jgi:anaerobic magnesium-protoporphyrin IX monomethyl ester cyclase
MKILLIFPPYNLSEEFQGLSEVGNMQPPLGIAYIGAVLEKAGHEVKIIDAPPLGLGIKEIVKEAEIFSPDYIGLSVSTVDFNKSLELAKELKKKLNLLIIIGGPHVTAIPEEVMSYSGFDFGVIGEGEETIVSLLSALKNKTDLTKVDGLIFRQKKKIIKNKPREYIKDLDQIPFPTRHLMPELSKYHPTPATYQNFPVGTMITSRGCPYQCNFCFRGVFGNKWRFRSPENVVSEMEILIKEYGAREIRLWDDTFNADTERVKDICRLIIKKKLKFSWTCLGRVNKADKEMFKLMKKAGCWQISYGIESGNEEILKSLNKGITKKMVEEAVKETTEAGVQALGFFILGLPGETEKTMRETIDFAKSLPLSVANFTIATPYPGTKLWLEAEKRGFLKDVSYDKLLVNLPDRLFYVPEGLTAKKVQEFEVKAYREFYRNPKFIFRQLGQIKDLGDLARKAKAFLTIQSI